MSDPAESVSRVRFNVLVLAVVLAVYALASHLYRLPRADNYSFREAQTAMITGNLVADGFDVLHPRVTFFGPEHPYLALEFPLYNAVVGGVYLLTGENPTMGRWVSVLCFLASCYYAYRLAQRAAGTGLARWTTAIYVFMPAMQAYGQSHRPDMMMYWFVFGALHHTTEALERAGRKDVLAALLYWAGAILLKMTPAVLFACYYAGAVAVFGLWRRPKWSRAAGLSALAVVLVVLLGLWVRHAATVNAGTPYGTESFREFNYGTWRDRIDPSYYALIAKEALKLLSPPWLLLMGLGLVCCARARDWAFPFSALLVGGVLSYAIFWRTSIVNPHYMMIFALPCAFFGAHGATWLAGQWSAESRKKWVRPGIAAFGACALLVNAVINFGVVDSFAKRLPHRRALAAADYVRDVVPRGGNVAFIAGTRDWTETDPVFFFYSARVGRNLGTVEELAARRQELVARDYRWAVICHAPAPEFAYQDSASVERELARAGFPVQFAGDGFIVAQLR